MTGQPILRPGHPEYRICSRTVLDNAADPEITFDAEGVSNYALRYERDLASIVAAASTGGREGELQGLVEPIKKAGQGKPYDCIVGVSGGVDSTFLINRAVKLGLRPLAVHFDSGWNSELAVSNIHGIIEKLGLDLFTEVVDWREMRDLQLAFFKASVPNVDIPTDHAFPAVAYRQAARYGIRYILSGTNLATEAILPPAWLYDSRDAVHVRALHRLFGSVKLKTYPIMGLFKREIWFGGVRAVRTLPLLDFMPYVREDAVREISDDLGWRDYGGKHNESVFTRWFQGYYLREKFGIDIRRAHLSTLILSGQITRDEAFAELEKPAYDPALVAQDHDFIAKKLGLTPAEFDAVLAEEPKAHLAYPNSLWAWTNLWRPARVIAGALRKFR